MSRIRLILLSMGALAATAVVGVFATASASAITPVYLVCLEKSGSGKKFTEAACKTESSSGKFELVPVASSLPYNGTSGISKLSGTIDGEAVIITCQKNIDTGEIGPEGLSKGTTLFDECSVGNSKETFANCEVPSITVTYRDQLIENSSKEIEDELAPEKGTNFVEIVIKNKPEKTCTVKGTFPVTGTQDAKLKEATVAKLLRILEFKPSGSKLKLGGETATFETTVSLDLNNDDDWGASIP